MPKRSGKNAKGKRDAGRVTGPVSHWSTSQRLGYHLAEAAMHLQSISQILEEEEAGGKKRKEMIAHLLEHRKQSGLRIRAMWAICEKLYDDMLRQP